MEDFDFSPRAQAVTARTYLRPDNYNNDELETFKDQQYRATIKHHEMLAESNNRHVEKEELEELYELGLQRKSWLAGRTQWLGGTEYSQTRPACQFNCALAPISNVFDFVDGAWLLLNGSGVGIKPIAGTLHGFHQPLKVELIQSKRGPNEKGPKENQEYVQDGKWTIKVGDSAEAWAKSLGKLFQSPSDVHTLIIDGSNCRGPGSRLSGYGWICNGFSPLGDSMLLISKILNRKVGNLLDEIEIGDCFNLVGTILSSRRSAQTLLMDSYNPLLDEFKHLKNGYWNGTPWRRQSNNTVLYWQKPTRKQLIELLHACDSCGGDPGIANAAYALSKCSWFQGFNPCFEILLAFYGFCNLVTNCLPRFNRNFSELERAVYIISRANYRQSCVDLRDGILQPQWHQTNESLHLCGTSLTGVTQASWLSNYQIRRLRNASIMGAYSQADEWHLPRPKAVTTLKPEGTGSKAMGSTKFGEIVEGINNPLGKHIFNWINFSAHDPLVQRYESSGYRTLINPSDSNNVLVCFPVEYRGVPFTKIDGKSVNLESAVSQLDRYLRWTNLWCDYNASATISYSPEEIPEIAEWLDQNWDRGYIATAFLRRNDPTKTAKDLGHPYLPQEVVYENDYREYLDRIKPVDISNLSGFYDLDVENCPTGVCPTR